MEGLRRVGGRTNKIKKMKLKKNKEVIFFFSFFFLKKKKKHFNIKLSGEIEKNQKQTKMIKTGR